MKISLNLSEATYERAQEVVREAAGGNVSVLADAAIKYFVRLPLAQQVRLITLHKAERNVSTRSDWMGAFWRVLADELDTVDRNANPMAPRHLRSYVLVFLMNRPDREDAETDPLHVHAMPDPVKGRPGAPRSFVFRRDDSPAYAAMTVAMWLSGQELPDVAPSSAPNAYDAFNFIDMQKRQLVAAYDSLRSQASPYAKQALLNGILMALGSLKEAIAVLCHMRPDLAVVRDRFSDDLERWNRMRNDVAHVFQLVFGPPGKGSNSPWIPGGLLIGVYSPSDDTVRTGDSPAGIIALWDSIVRAFEISNELELAYHGIASDKRSEYERPIKEQIADVRKEIAQSIKQAAVGAE